MGSDVPKLTRRKLIATGAASALGVGLAGCQENGNGTPGNGTPGDGTPGGGPGGGSNALRISIINDPGSPLNPYITNNARWDWLVDLVFDRLLEPSPQVENPIPALATDVTQVDDRAKIWEATIRDGVQWHDGEPFTPEDVAFTIRYYKEGPHSRNAHHVTQVPQIDAVEVVGDRTVRFECAYPTPTLAKVTFADMPILAEHVWSEVDNPREYTGMPVGTGPYELTEYTQNERLRFEATGEYFLGDTIVDEVVVPVISDPSVTFTALTTGEIDSTVRPVPPETLGRFRANDDVRVVEATQLLSVDLRLNFARQPFRTHEFRWAVSRAVDKDAVVNVVMLGEAISGTEGFPHPRSPWTAEDIDQPYKPAAARRRLDELGYRDRDGDGVRESPDGEPLSFTIEAPSNEPQFIRAAELIKGQLDDVGFDLTVRTSDPGTIRSYYGSSNYDMYVASSNLHLAADPDQFLMAHRGGPKLLWDTTGSISGEGTLAYPEYEQLEQRYFEAATLEEQVSVLHEMHRLHARQPVLIPLWYPMSHQAFRPDAHDEWAESPGFGIHHKWSFMAAADRGAAVTTTFD